MLDLRWAAEARLGWVCGGFFLGRWASENEPGVGPAKFVAYVWPALGHAMLGPIDQPIFLPSACSFRFSKTSPHATRQVCPVSCPLSLQRRYLPLACILLILSPFTRCFFGCPPKQLHLSSCSPSSGFVACTLLFVYYSQFLVFLVFWFLFVDFCCLLFVS